MSPRKLTRACRTLPLSLPRKCWICSDQRIPTRGMPTMSEPCARNTSTIFIILIQSARRIQLNRVRSFSKALSICGIVAMDTPESWSASLATGLSRKTLCVPIYGVSISVAIARS